MNKTVYKIMSVIVLFALTLGSHSNAGASPATGVVSIVTPTIYDCNNSTSAGIKIKNTHDVTIRNCKIIVSAENGIQITDSYNIIIDNVDISSTYPEGSGINLESTASGLTHDVTIQNFYVHGPMGWGIVGSYQSLLRITVKNGTIEGIGQAGGMQKHGMYVNNWQSSLIEDVTIKDSWNSGIKIVGVVPDMRINRVTIANSGRSGGSGPGISLDAATITGLVITGCNISNSTSPAIWTLSKVNGVTVDGCKFFNNYYAVEIPSGGTGWRVVNNVGYNQSSYAPARTSLQLDGSNSDIANNFFDYNNWYYDGLSPVRVGSTTYSLAGWQAKGADLHSVSVNPNLATATPSKAPTVTFTPTRVATSITPTASPVVASATPTALSVTASPTPTASSVPASPTLTASPVPVLPTATTQPVVQPTNTPQEVSKSTTEKVFDDKDGSFVYSPGWQDVSNQKAYGGSYKQTIKNGSFATFTFTGESFSVLYKSGPAFRKIDVYVDGLLVGTINERGKSAFQKRWNYPSQLTLGSHTLKLVFVTGSTSDSTSASVDAVIVR